MWSHWRLSSKTIYCQAGLCVGFVLTVPFICTDHENDEKRRWFGTETERFHHYRLHGWVKQPCHCGFQSERLKCQCVHHTGALLNPQLHSHSHCPYGSMYSWVPAHMFVCVVQSDAVTFLRPIHIKSKIKNESNRRKQSDKGLFTFLLQIR